MLIVKMDDKRTYTTTSLTKHKQLVILFGVYLVIWINLTSPIDKTHAYNRRENNCQKI